MTQRTVEVDNTKGGSAGGQITPEETRVQKKARLAEVYDRGVAGARLHVELPPDTYGEWVPNVGEEIHRKELLGFEIDSIYAPARALHNKGDGKSLVGDVVFMTCSMEQKEILDEVRRERYEKIHAPKGGKQKEEKDFISLAPSETKPQSTGNVARVRPQQITDALKAASNQS